MKYCQLFPNQRFKQIDFWAQDAQNKESDTKAVPPLFVFSSSDGYHFPDWHVPEFIDDT